MKSFRLSSSSEPEVSGLTKKCPECLADIPQEAKKCSHCGTKQKESITAGKLILTIIVVGLVTSFILAGSDSGSSTSTPKTTTVTETQINIMAENYVEAVLKSPSTADFPTLAFTHYDLGNNKHKIVSYVDSQNSFGAMIRSNWSVILTYNGGDWSNQGNWTLNELIFDGELLYSDDSSEFDS